MYQQNPDIDLSYLTKPEEEFNKFVKIALDALALSPNMVKSFDQEYDIRKTYEPTWACIWNKQSNVGRKCNIVQKK